MQPATGPFNPATGSRLESLRAGIQWFGCTVDDGCAFVTSANGCLQVKYRSVYASPSPTV
jgi:hypothetical protein